MPEQMEPEPPRPAATRSRKLGITVTILALLPVILPLPLWGIESLWIVPLAAAAWESCRAFYCPAAEHWEHLEWILALGPSILIAVGSILLGYIGLFLARWHPTSPENVTLLRTSITCGFIWAGIFGFIFIWGYSYLAGTTI